MHPVCVIALLNIIECNGFHAKLVAASEPARTAFGSPSAQPLSRKMLFVNKGNPLPLWRFQT